MSLDTPLITDDDWPFDAARERTLILQRFCERTDLEPIGARHDIDWFEDNTVKYRNEADARAEIAAVLDDPSDIEAALTVGDRSGDGFYGWRYVVEINESLTVTRGPAREHWQTIASELETHAADNDRLRAFLQGIAAAAAESEEDTVRVGFGKAEAMGNAYYDDGQLAANTVATDPGLVTGISTRKSANSGRQYYIAREVAPVISAVLESQATRDPAPTTTPGQEVPADLDRRIPKFEEVLNEVTVKAEDIARFERILADHDAVEYWAEYIAPTVEFRPRAKKAILCMLASPNDANGTKGRTNAIIFGPPSTGKSAFKKFLVEEFGAYSIDGARVSKVDLTYNKNTDEDGLLVRAHRGLAVIEEADEMTDDALGAALTALGESGQIEIQDMRLPAEVRGVMLGNYRSRDEIIAQHSEALLNRFEFVLEFTRLDDDQRDAALDTQYEYFRQPTDPTATEELKTYLAWVRDFDPEIPSEELARIEEYKRERISSIETIRDGVAILNVAYTIARLNHRDVTLQDYKRAFDLVATEHIADQ